MAVCREERPGRSCRLGRQLVAGNRSDFRPCHLLRGRLGRWRVEDGDAELHPTFGAFAGFPLHRPPPMQSMSVRAEEFEKVLGCRAALLVDHPVFFLQRILRRPGRVA